MTVEEKGQAILMEIFDIKRGDILVAKYNDVEQYEFERDYIIFIASGSSLSGIIYDKYISY